MARTAIALCITVSSPSVSFAADIRSIPCKKDGIEELESLFPYGYFNLYVKNFEGVPDYVIEYYQKCGGTLTFTTNKLDDSETILGLYHPNTHNIELRLYSNYILLYGSELYSVPAHEFGHFIYDMSRYDADWTEEMNNAVKNEFAKRSLENTACTDMHETFAYAYTDYLNRPWNLSSEMKQTIEKSLAIIKKLNGG